MKFRKLIGIVLSGIMPLVCMAVPVNASCSATNFRNSTSVSPFTDAMFSQGFIYKDNDGNVAKNTAELQKLFIKHGATEVFTRIATNRYKYASNNGSDHSLQTGIERAKLAKKLGVPLNPEIGLFKEYGDVFGQPSPDFSEYPEIKLPGQWNTLTLQQMTPILKQYGRIVAKEILKTGVKVNVWDIGNEVNYGIAGVALGQSADAVDPEIGKQSFYNLVQMNDLGVSWLSTHLWNYQAQLMHAVQEGILSVDNNAKFATHIALIPFDASFTQAFYKSMKDNGFRLDVAGLSFYPSNYSVPSDRLEALKTVVSGIVKNNHLPVFIAEYGYPSKQIQDGAYSTWNNVTPGYDLTEEGQAALLKDLTDWGVKNGICGIRPWAPDLVSGGWNEMSFFNSSGNIATSKPVLDSIRQGLKNNK